MAPTLDDLRLTLREMADEHPAPAPADLLTELRDRRRAERTRRRWGYAAGVAAAATVAVVATQTAEPGPESVGTVPAERPGDAADRGWVLTDGSPPEVADGLTLLGSAELSAGGTVQVPDPEPTGRRQRYAVLWCDTGPAADDPAIQDPALVLDEGAVTIPCLPRSGAGTVTPVPLPPAGEDGQLGATWEGDLPRDAEAVVAVYEEASRSGYPYPPLPDPPLDPPAVGEDATALDAGTPLVFVQDPVEDDLGIVWTAEMHTETVALGPGSTLDLWAGGPGELRVLVDGIWVTDDGDGADAWAGQDPELREGGWQAFTPGQRSTLELPEELLPAAGESRTVQVAVQPVMGVHPWQVAVTDVGEAPAALAPVPDGTGVPEWFGGYRLAATWELPTDGSWQTLELPPELEGLPVVWATTCPDPDPDRASLAGLSAGGQPIDMGLSCTDVDNALINMHLTWVSGTPLTTAEDPVVASLPGSGDGFGTVRAYVPVPFEEFDFAAGRPVPVEGDSLAATFPEGLEVEAELTLDDLADGRTTLTMTDRTMVLRISSEGVGRVRIEGAGSLAGSLPSDGWWSSWTDQAYSEPVLGSLDHALSPGAELRFTAEGYEPGSLRIELLRVADR